MIRTQKNRLSRILPLSFVILFLLYYLRSFLPLDTLPARGDLSLPFQGSDLTPEFAVWSRIAIQAIKDQGILPLWNPFTHAGTPLFELPQTGAISLATGLGFLFPPEAAIKWSMLIHAGLGVSGIYFFCVAFLRLSPAFAAMGGLTFGLGTFFLDHFRVGHLNQIYPMALMPWALFTFWKSIQAPRLNYRWAILSGLIVGIQILEGADNVLLYELIAFSLVLVSVFANLREFQKKLIRMSFMGILVGIASFALSSFQLLPMLNYLPNTGRTGCLPWEFASERIPEVAHPIPGGMYLSLFVLGCVFAWKNKRGLALWLIAISTLSITVASRTPLFKVLWLFMPGFCYQRIPGRALVLFGVVGPILAAAGIQWVWDVLAKKPLLQKVCTILVIFGLTFELWKLAPSMPPMALVKQELESNSAMQWIKQNKHHDRMHIWETPNRHWGTEHVTVPLHLEVIAGYTSSENQDYFPFDFLPPSHRTFFDDSYKNPAKFWGLLNVRYVLSMQPRSEPGFHLIQKVPLCPLEICQPAKSAGPWIYENEQVLPRAYQVQYAIAIIGSPRQSFETTLDILNLAQFDPAQTVVIQVSPDEATPEVNLRIAAKGDFISGLPSWDSEEGRQSVDKFLKSIRPKFTSPIQADFSRPNMNQIQVQSHTQGWLVISERIGLFPGWRASNETQSIKIYRAQGVLGAMYISSPSLVKLDYEPRGLRAGLWILLGSSLFWILIEAIFYLRKTRASPSARLTQ